LSDRGVYRTERVTALTIEFIYKAMYCPSSWRCIGEAMMDVEITKDRLWEAEVHRMAGEIALKSPTPDAAKTEAYFERALAVAREQRRNPGNCTRRSAWRGSTAIRAGRSKLANYSRQSTAGSPKASIRST
jgi:hypothetical protein